MLDKKIAVVIEKSNKTLVPSCIQTIVYSKTQQELRVMILRFLDRVKIPYVESDGNIYSIRFMDQPLFVAHMDTVDDSMYLEPMHYGSTAMSRDGAKYCLGGDDRAGINLILNHIEDINFCFTRDEEIGCLGSTSLASDVDFTNLISQLPCGIQLDRKNSSDIIKYCSDDLIAEVKKHAPTYEVASGSVTDVMQWTDWMPSVNLSVGYYNPHQATEYLDYADFILIDSYIPELNKIRGKFDDYVAPYYKSGYYGSGYYNGGAKKYKGYAQSTDCCDFCGDDPITLYKTSLATHGYESLLCDKCLTSQLGITKIYNY